MALKNNSDKTVKVMWNSIEKDVQPGEEIDVRDFNVENKYVFSTERVLMDKHHGKFVQVANREKKMEEENSALNEKTAFLENSLNETKENLKQSEVLAETLQNQVDDLKQKNEDLTIALEEANNLLAENKIEKPAKKKK